VTFWIRDATEAAAVKLVPEFNKTHPNLKIVVHVTSPNDDTSQLATAIRAGDPPDLVGLNDIDVPEFSHEGALMNITSYVNALPYKSVLSPGHLSLAAIGNQYYGVPYLSDLSVLWYNKDLFKKAGIMSPPTTFAEIASDAKAITALGTPSNPVYGLSFAGDCQGCLGFVMRHPDREYHPQRAAQVAPQRIRADLGQQRGSAGRPDTERPDLGPGLRQG
jgi:multiple sugar transport system substrate-binding protein